MGSVHCYFCGGHKCKYENYDNWLDAKDSHNAIVGLYSNWITDNILATARPSSRIMEQYDIIDQFHEHNIGAIINLQQSGEHKDCGDGLINDEFSYTPDDFMRANIFYYNFGWKDMTVPPIELVLNIVQVMQFTLVSRGQKVAIHCHAGLGRTGLVVAAYLVLACRLPAQQAIRHVRDHRPLSIQTQKQASFIQDFEAFVLSIRRVYDPSCPSLSTVLSRQRLYLHGVEAQQLRHVPKILHICCDRLLAWAAASPPASSSRQLLRDLSEPEKITLAKCKSDVDEGEWEKTTLVDGVVAVQMLLEWLQQLSPRLLHEGTGGILAGKPPKEITPSLSSNVLKSLALLIPTLHKVASVMDIGGQHTLYSTFVKALIPIKYKNSSEAELKGVAFLRDVTL